MQDTINMQKTKKHLVSLRDLLLKLFYSELSTEELRFILTLILQKLSQEAKEHGKTGYGDFIIVILVWLSGINTYGKLPKKALSILPQREGNIDMNDIKMDRLDLKCLITRYRDSEQTSLKSLEIGRAHV